VAASERAWLPIRLARNRARALKGVESGVLCEYCGQVMCVRYLQRQSTGARLPTRGHARPIQIMQVHRVRHESSGKWSAVCGCAVCVCGVVSLVCPVRCFSSSGVESVPSRWRNGACDGPGDAGRWTSKLALANHSLGSSWNTVPYMCMYMHMYTCAIRIAQSHR
jgi:hypothetical protein